MFGWFRFRGKSIKKVVDEVLGFFDRVESVLGVFEELIEEGIEILDKIEMEIREHEKQIEELDQKKKEVTEKILKIKRVLGA
jgi:cell shape-determining protein MreC